MRNEETMCEGLLSVVIPVYNIRDYVERCVRSVLAQPDVQAANRAAVFLRITSK